MNYLHSDRAFERAYDRQAGFGHNGTFNLIFQLQLARMRS